MANPANKVIKFCRKRVSTSGLHTTFVQKEKRWQSVQYTMAFKKSTDFEIFYFTLLGSSEPLHLKKKINQY